MNISLDLMTLEHYGANQDSELEARRVASRIFSRFYTKGQLLRLWSKLIGRTNRLRPANALNGTKSRQAKQGVVTVQLNQIVGSEGRCDDFDGRFYPLHAQVEDRWVGIYVARRQDVVLPVVELIQDGTAYYVRDGHHRISVARALGQQEIEARIVN